MVPRGSRGHEATIVSVDIGSDGVELTLEWTGRKTKPLSNGVEAKPADPSWVGEDVAFVVSDAASLTRRRSGRVWKAKDGPGAWLTHGKAPAPVEISDDEGDTDVLVDDISQIEEGTTAGMRFEVRGMVGGTAKVVLEHVTRLRDDLAPDWPQPTGHGGYRVVITGEPNYTVDMQMVGGDGDHNTAGLKATAMRLVNTVAAVVEARPGLLSALDLPLVTGRGLVS